MCPAGNRVLHCGRPVSAFLATGSRCHLGPALVGFGDRASRAGSEILAYALKEVRLDVIRHRRLGARGDLRHLKVHAQSRRKYHGAKCVERKRERTKTRGHFILTYQILDAHLLHTFALNNLCAPPPRSSESVPERRTVLWRQL